jgi:Tol biopolymer transport system component
VALAGLMATAALLVAPSAHATPRSRDVSPTDLPASAPGRLAFTRGDYVTTDTGWNNSPKGLGTIGLDGGDQRTLTDPQPIDATGYAGYDHTPQWSPDGTWLAYLQDRPDGSGGATDGVAAIPRDGGDVQIIDASGWGPTWSPDERELAWVSKSDDGTTSIAVADVTTTPTTLTVTNRRTLPLPQQFGTVGWPTFSPDGQLLAFTTGSFPSNDLALDTLSVDDGTFTQVSHDAAVELGTKTYSFSPDGSQLLFQAVVAGSGGYDVAMLVDIDGTDQHELPAGPVFSAAWSPTGDMIATVSNAPRTGIALRSPVDGSSVGSGVIGADAFSDWGGLTFSPDGSTVYSVATPIGADGSPNLYAVPVNGDPVQQLTTDNSVFPDTVQAVDPGRVLREYGESAAATSAAAATDNMASADALVVAPQSDSAASLAAAPMAARLGAPELLSDAGSLSPAVVRAAHRLGATQVVLVGKLSSRVATTARAAGLSVTRVGNTTSPYRSSAAIAEKLTSHRALILPSPGAWKLSLATAGYAAYTHRPMLYADRAGVPAPTRHALRALGITSVTVVGGDKDVTPALLHELRRLGVKVHRLNSSDRYSVSAEFARRELASGVGLMHPIISTGTRWTSSAAAPALAAILGQVNVLVDGTDATHSKPTLSWVGQHRSRILTAKLLGNVNVMQPRVEAQLEHQTRH